MTSEAYNLLGGRAHTHPRHTKTIFINVMRLYQMLMFTDKEMRAAET